MSKSKNLFVRAFVSGLIISSVNMKAQTACFSSLDDYSYSMIADCPQFTTAGDINGDGKPDLVTSTCNSKIITLLGTGNGYFNTGLSISVAPGAFPMIHRLKDVNGDSKLDVITMNYNSKDVSVLLGTGTGSFVNTGTISCGWPGGSGQLADIAVIDVNNDSKQDIVVAMATSPIAYVSVMLGNGTGLFGAPSSYTTTPNNVYQMVTDDINNDGNQDLLLSTGTSFIAIHLGNGTGSFNGFTTTPCQSTGWDITTGDFNGDGKRDFAAAHSFSNSISIGLGSGTGTFSYTAITGIVDTPYSVTSNDFDGDGKQDLMVQCDGSMLFMKGNGNGTFVQGKSVVTDMNTNLSGGIGSADLNADGKPDVFGASNAMQKRVFALINKGSGNLFGMPDVKFKSLSYSGGGLIVDDLNGDGKQDLIIGAINDIEVAMGMGGNNYSVPVTYTTGATGAVNFLTEADFNNDGKKDIVSFNGYPHSIRFMAGTGTGAFTPASSFTVANPPGGINWADLNNDGNNDLLITHSGSNNIIIYSGNGSGGFTNVGNISTTSNPGPFTIGDFNNDGNQDVAYAISTNVNVVYGNGAFVFTAPTSYGASGSFATSATNKDVNNDGRPDIVVTNYSGGNNTAILLGTASGTFQPAILVASGTNPKDVKIEDMNNDGNQDIITGNYTNSDYSILLGNGTGNFSTALNYPVGRVYSASGLLAVKDANNDGTKDVIIKAYINSNFSLGRNNVIIANNNTASISSIGSNTICLGNTITLHANSGAFSYLWNPGGSAADSLVVNATGVYSVTVANAAGTCLSTATKSITVVVCTTIEEKLMKDGGISIYPNPTNNDFTIQSAAEEHIVISNDLGQTMTSIHLSENNNFKATINNLPVGIYFIKGETVKGKVIVVK